MALTDIRNFVPVGTDLGTAGQPTEGQLAEVAAAGFQVVVNLGLLGTEYALADEAGLATSLGLEYHHVPVQFDAPEVGDLRRFAEVMDGVRASGKRAFVHCAANYRVSTFVSLYGQLRLGWSAAEADAHARRLWSPNPTWLAFIERCRRELGIG